MISNSTLLHRAQNAFIPGRDIHSPIDIVKECFRQSKLAANGSGERELHAIFYDISKAYDTVRWSSITEAMRATGLDEDFITFVHQSLVGTKVCIKTSTRGRTTEHVDMNQAVRQGDPLAPLLFDIVMDALHRGYAKIGGYQLRNGPLVSSVGYCDDTVILASSLKEIRAMNEWTCTFFLHQGFNISASKTYATGRHDDGTPLLPFSGDSATATKGVMGSGTDPGDSIVDRGLRACPTTRGLLPDQHLGRIPVADVGRAI